MKSLIFALVLTGTAAAQAVLPNAPAPGYFHNPVNTTLAVADLASREIDAISTRAAVTNLCGCIKETGDFGMFQAAANSNGSQFAYSTGIALGNIYISRMLWHASEKRHSSTLRWASRLVLVSDIAVEIHADARNFELAGMTSKAGSHKIGRR